MDSWKINLIKETLEHWILGKFNGISYLVFTLSIHDAHPEVPRKVHKLACVISHSDLTLCVVHSEWLTDTFSYPNALVRRKLRICDADIATCNHVCHIFLLWREMLMVTNTKYPTCVLRVCWNCGSILFWCFNHGNGIPVPDLSAQVVWGKANWESLFFNWKYVICEVCIIVEDEHGDFTFKEYLQHYDKEIHREGAATETRLRVGVLDRGYKEKDVLNTWL